MKRVVEVTAPYGVDKARLVITKGDNEPFVFVDGILTYDKVTEGNPPLNDPINLDIPARGATHVLIGCINTGGAAALAGRIEFAGGQASDFGQEDSGSQPLGLRHWIEYRLARNMLGPVPTGWRRFTCEDQDKLDRCILKAADDNAKELTYQCEASLCTDGNPDGCDATFLLKEPDDRAIGCLREFQSQLILANNHYDLEYVVTKVRPYKPRLYQVLVRSRTQRIPLPARNTAITQTVLTFANS